MSDVNELTSDNFDTTVSKGVTLVDFWAEWCGPCKMIGPVVEQLASEYEGKATVGKIDVDSQAELAQRYNVSSIPTLIVMKDGEESKRFIGVTSKTELAEALDSAAG